MTKNQKVKTVQFAVGVDLLGSKMTLTASERHGTELEATNVGIVAYSRSTGRTVLIPYPNIKGIEFFPEEVAAKKLK